MKIYRYNLVWEKEQGTDFFMAKKKPLKNFEDVCIFYRKQPTYNPQMVDVGKSWKKNDTGKTFNYITGHQEHNYKKTSVGTLRYPLSILKFDRPKQKGEHPTQKPVALFEYLIKTYTNEGDTVLDNCAGSFTTAVACDNINRNWICMEKEAGYCDIGYKRINENRERLGLPNIEHYTKSLERINNALKAFNLPKRG